jgi:hypothetical protein
MREVSKPNDWRSWSKFFLEAVGTQTYRNLEVAESIRALYETMKQQFSTALASKGRVNALDFVFTNPVFRNSKFTGKSGIPTASAARFTRVLLGQGLLRTLEEPPGRRPALRL